MSAAVFARNALGRFPRPVWCILLHSLIFGLALSIADLLFNFYLVSLGYAADTAGLLSTVGRAAGMITGLPIGILVDRLMPQRALIVGLLVYSLGMTGLLLSERLIALVLAQFIVGASYILVSTAVVPLLTTVTPTRLRSTVFGWNASATLVIGLIGSAIAGLLPSFFAGIVNTGPQTTLAYRLALTTTVALGMLAMLPLFARLPAAPSDQEGIAEAANTAQRLPIRRLARFALAALLLGVGGGAILPFQNLFLRQTFGLDDAAVGVTLGWVSLGGLGALFGAPVTDRIGLRRGAALLRLCAVPAVLLMMLPFFWPAALGLFLRNMFVSASYPQNDALVMQATPISQRGLAMSMLSVLWSGGWAITSLISGWVQLRWGFTPVFFVAAVSYVLSAIAIITMPETYRKPAVKEERP
jgi:MFS family permease